MGYNDSEKSMPLDFNDVGKLVIMFDVVILKDQSFVQKGFFEVFSKKNLLRALIRIQ